MVMDQRAADHDVGQLTHRHRGKFSLQVLYPQCGRRGTGLRQKDDGGGLTTSSAMDLEIAKIAEEKLSLQVLYPHRSAHSRCGYCRSSFGLEGHEHRHDGDYCEEHVLNDRQEGAQACLPLVHRGRMAGRVGRAAVEKLVGDQRFNHAPPKSAASRMTSFTRVWSCWPIRNSRRSFSRP
jgi:hypothetical protein